MTTMATKDLQLLREDLLGVCDKLAYQGEECVFFSINVLTEKIFCCGSSYGQEFLMERSFFVQSFLEFCKEKNTSKLQMVKTEYDEAVDYTENKSNTFPDTVQNTTINSSDDVICIISDDEDDDGCNDEIDEISRTESNTEPEDGQRIVDMASSDEHGIQERSFNLDEANNNSHQKYSEHCGQNRGEKESISSIDVKIDGGNIGPNETAVSEERKKVCENNFETSDKMQKDSEVRTLNDSCGENEMTSETDTSEQVTSETDTSEQVTPIKGGLNMCQTCGESFFSSRALQNHINEHKSRREVKKTYMRLHAGEKPFNCNFCDRQFSDSAHLMSHLKMHRKILPKRNTAFKTGKSSSKKHVCNICLKSFKNAGLLKIHKQMQCGTKVFKCSVCPKLCKTWSNLKMHEVTHRGDRKGFRCNICWKKFTNKSSCMTHEKMHKVENISNQSSSSVKTGNKNNKYVLQKKNIWTCQVCSLEFKYYSDLQRHATRHIGTDASNCGVCGDNFPILSRLRAHLKSKGSCLSISSSNKTIACNICHKNFTNHGNLANHMNGFHRKSVMYQCSFCTKKFSSFSRMKNHEQIHLTETKDGHFHCNKCGNKFVTSKNFIEHSKMHKSGKAFKCTICSKKFLSLRICKIHLTAKHHENSANHQKYVTIVKIKEKSNVIESSKARDQLSCQTGDTALSSKKHCATKRHYDSTGRISEFKCTICFKRFKDIGQLKVHSMKCTLVSRPFQCKTCGRRCATIGNLRQHRQIHANGIEPDNNEKKLNIKSVMSEQDEEKPYSCHICGKRWSTLGGLKTHHRIHRKSNPDKNVALENPLNTVDAILQDPSNESEEPRTFFLCRICDRAFEESSLLKKHWKIHENISGKPFSCKYCSKTFYDKSVMKWHESIHTEKKSNQCKICKIKVFGASTLKIHMQLHKQY